MADISRIPNIRTALADNVGVVLSFAAVGGQGAGYLINNGPNECWIAFDAMPAAASYANGRKHMGVGETVNLDDIIFNTIGGLCAGANTAQLEVIGLIRPGNTGQGLA